MASNVELEFLPGVSFTHMQRALLFRLRRETVVPTTELLEIWPDKSHRALNMVLFGLRKKLNGTGYKLVNHRGLGYSLAKE